MSASKLFVTGASGYIGGSALQAIVAKHPEYQITALVRNDSQAQAVTKQFPKVKTVIGDLDSVDVLTQEAGKADLVLNFANADHAGAVSTLTRALKGTSGRLIHTSGTGVLHDARNGYGEPSDKVYHDVDDVQEITSLDLSQPHRDTDIALIQGGKDNAVPTTIVCPPLIYGEGKGPVKTLSTQIPLLIKHILARGKGLKVGQGKNLWGNVHIDDLSDAYVLLVEEALKPNGGNVTWGPSGYYFIENGEHVWGDVATATTKVLQQKSHISTADVEGLPEDEINKIQPFGAVLWGGNSRGKAQRIRALGWKPHAPDVYSTLAGTVDAHIKASA
ncbi:MAG: peroxisome- protein [Chaenotheca gracillima]|nr:MAG: peroxisome- protein [Chaenotheca gracillima]